MVKKASGYKKSPTSHDLFMLSHKSKLNKGII